ncbi:hypothetical protein CWB73_20440 [Pseudoalteromonas phenolica]|uniref:Uncharacterized protein n=2 Tax=Pseudoalteromonas phenolica TaxID=161398 RepID=A0A5S3YMZ1_9GAMM|nr:hypothetical protein CWB73_20440 [Pseudoalteromonas phenolica]
MLWPPLSDYKYTSGRQATEDDINAGAAVFMLQIDGKNVGKPIDIIIPQYAVHIDQETGEKTNVIIIQAEETDDSQVIGAINIKTNEIIAALKFEFEFLGNKNPKTE